MLKRIFILTSSLLLITACGDDESDDNAGTPDTGSEADVAVSDDSGVSIDDAGSEDTGTVESDAEDVEDADSIRQDVVEHDGALADAEDTTSDPDVSECDVAAVAAEFLDLRDSVADATWTPGEEDGQAALDASLGGAAAAAESAWVYVDLIDGELLELTDVQAYESDEWTLAFKRTEIRLNGDASGAGAWLTARLEGTTFEDASAGRDAEWRSDAFVDTETCEVVTEGRGSAATAFGIWYDYDPATHSVTAPEGVVYALYNSSTHVALKLQIVSYDGGVYDLRWGAM